MRLLILIGLLTLSVVACKKDNDEDVVVDYRERDDQLIQDYLEKNDIEAQKDAESGLYYRVRGVGEGDAVQANDSVVIRYIGKVIKRNSESDEPELGEKPFDFTPNAEPARRMKLSGLIEGWKIGIPMIKKGGSIDLFIPSHLGYGNSYHSGIPANSVLFFDIDLEDVVVVPEEE